MYAIFQDGGHQYRVAQGQRIQVEFRADAEPGQVLTFDQVCLVGGGGEPKVGKPFVAGAKIEAKVTRPDVRGKKLYPSYYRRRKHSKRRIGHRQHYIEVEITGISA